MSSQNKNAVYRVEQVDAYLSRISFPVTKYKPISSTSARSEGGLEYLSAIQRYHLASVPFENLYLHYSKERVISLNKDDLFEKIVTSGSRRGGYCMEQNMLLGTMLRTMGFEVIPTGARIMVGGQTGGWSHHVLLICLGSKTYMVDVGFGGNGPTRPMPLVHGQVSKWGATDADMRLIYQEPSNPIVQGIWILEHRISESHEWTPNYCFGMTEFFPRDYEVMSFATSTRNTSWFTYQIICLRMILDEDLDDITGAVILSDSTLKRRVHDNIEILTECATEQQRVNVLADYFGIKLSDREQAAIKGTVTELKG